MTQDVCPKCGKEYLAVSHHDMRDVGGTKFTDYKHEMKELGPFTEITEWCTVIHEDS